MSNLDSAYRRGDAITFLIKHKPFIDVSIPPSSNDYRDACCVTIAIYDSSLKELLVEACDMTRVPNRPGWYFYRYQTDRDMHIGTYIAAITTITKIDGKDYSSRSLREFTILDDGII